MIVRNLKPYTFYTYEIVTDEEGCQTEGYSDNAQTIDAYIYPASGRVQSEMYGERLAYMLNMMVNLPASVKERDGVCEDSDKVNYRVVAVAVYSEHAQITLERV